MSARKQYDLDDQGQVEDNCFFIKFNFLEFLMGQQRQAFISYRREDYFAADHNGEAANDASSNGFVFGFQEKLKRTGFDGVFLDQVVIDSGRGWPDMIFDAVSSCDAFVLIIGKNWLEILHEKAKQGGHDVLLEEIVVALSHDRNIIPVLVDGAQMPHAGQLPKKIKSISLIQAMQINSDDEEDVIAKEFYALFSSLDKQKTLGAAWRKKYIIFGIIAWVLTGIAPNLIGIFEFGWSAWYRLALIWGGLFIWPVAFIPFAMLGLYQPISGLVEQIVGPGSLERRMRYMAPFAFAIAIGLVGATIDILADEVVWTVKPRAGPICGDVAAAQRQPSALPLPSDVFFTYGTMPNKYLTALYDEKSKPVPFWLRDENRCWPNVFFYLTGPMMTSIGTDKNYLKERDRIVSEYRKIEKYDTESEKFYSRSYTFYFYCISMFLMLTLMAIGVIFALYYALFGVNDPRNELRKLKLPVENAYLGLLYAFITLMMWHPFRVITNYYKSLTCSNADDEKGCIFTLNSLFNDSFLFFFVFFGYIIITIGLFVEERIKRIILINGITVAAIILITALTYYFRQEIPEIMNRYQLSIIIIASLALLFVWTAIDPGKMRQEKFRSKFPELE